MTERFLLRFESGDRRGDTVPVPRAGLLIGRREGNDLIVADPSVSGRHALVRPVDGALAVEDLGSTNGIHVDGRKVERGSVAPGAVLRIGKVEFAVVDTEAAGAAPAPVAASEPAAEPALGPGVPALEDDIDLGGAPLLEDEIDLGGGAVGGIPAARVPSAPAAQVPGAGAGGAPAPLEQAPAVAATQAVDGAEAPGELHSIDESALERSRSRRGSPVVTIVVVLLLLGGAGFAAFTLLGQDGGGGEGPGFAAPLVVQGNLLVGGDLEGDDAEDLLATEGAGGRFFADRYYAATGAAGLGLSVDAGTAVRAATPTVRVRTGQDLVAAATVAVEERATARVGLEFVDSTELRRPLAVWSAAPAPDSTERLEARASVPGGYDRARLLIAAGDADPGAASDGDDAPPVGEVAVDDLALAPTNEPTAVVVTAADFEARVSEPARNDLVLQHIADILLTARAAANGQVLAPAARLALSSAGDGLARVELEGGASRIGLELWPALIGDDSRDLAMTDADGYRARSGEFTSTDVEALVLGVGVRLVRVVFDAPVEVSGRERAGRQSLTVDLGSTRGFTLQLSFKAELQAATLLATRARSAQRDERFGDVLAMWGELLREYPYEEGLVREADARRTELIATGLEELRAVEDEVERARFFALTGIYDRCAKAARLVVERYRPTEGGRSNEVHDRATELLAAIGAERDGIAVARSAGEPTRQRAILGWLERNEADDLAGRLREVVDG